MLLSHSAYSRPVELKRRFFKKIPSGARDRRSIVTPTTTLNEEQQEAPRLHVAALMSSAGARIVLDSDGRLALRNNRAMHLFGLTPRDVGRPIQDLEVSYRSVELRSHIDQAQLEPRAVWVRDVEQRRQPIRAQLGSQEAEPAEIVLGAVNRQGRALQVRVTLTHIRDHGAAAPAAMIAMDVVGQAD